MKSYVLWLSLLAIALAGEASAQNSTASPRIERASHCLPALGGCGKYKRMLTYPAHALSFGNAAASFALHPRGVNWLDKNGAMSLTIRRPKDYAGGTVKLTLFHQVLDDSPGEIVFTVTPVTFNHGNSFETYGAVATNSLAAPETLTLMFEQSALIAPGNGWSGDGQWWYLEIGRQGDFTGGLRVMSVALEY